MMSTVVEEKHHSEEGDFANDLGTSYTLDEHRRAALARVDNARFSWFHAKVCLVAGAGFFTDSYDIFAISIGSTMLGMVYGSGPPGSIKTLNSNQDLGLKVATPVGTVVGQVLFGFLADVYGRKRMYGIELMIIIVATFAQALSGSGPGVGIIGALIVWRFLLGVGIGGDYPLSAIISSEFASTRIRGRMVTAVGWTQGWGNLTSAIIGAIIVAAYKKAIINDQATYPSLPNVDFCWRLLIGLGCVPGVIALYFRLTIPETPRFTMDIERNLQQATTDIEKAFAVGSFGTQIHVLQRRVEAPKASRADFIRYFSKRENAKILFATCYSWFAVDVSFYGLGLNSSQILTTIGFGASTSRSALGAYTTLNNVCVGNIILAIAGLIPGYIPLFFLIDSWGRKPIQLMGFTMQTIIYLCMGFGYDAMLSTSRGRGAFVFLYCLANFFSNFGPNVTVFTIPGEVFPTRYRSTAHGISGACGKMGAVVAQVGFARLINIGGPNAFLKHILEIFAFFMFSGIFSTLLLPETRNKSLEELSSENQESSVRSSSSPQPLTTPA